MRLGDLDALKEAINKIIAEEIEIDEKWAKGLKYSLKIIDNAPTMPLPDFKDGYKQAIIDGKTNFSRPKGKWVFTPGVTCAGYYKCNKCGELEKEEMNFCPNCGVDMRNKEKWIDNFMAWAGEDIEE